MGTLYLVATPIGNLEDVTLRALRVLREASLVAAEDTRHTRKLFARHEIATPLVSYHAHNERPRAAELVERLSTGDVALVSDAGTPTVSDPGREVVAAALAAGHRVVPIPGPSAALAALIASGLPTDRFLFVGFLPRVAKERRAALRQLRDEPGTLIFYEAPHRLRATLADARAELGDRDAAAARELTKLHEEVVRGRLDDLVARYAEQPPRGEFTVVVAGAPPPTPTEVDPLPLLRAAIARGLKPRAAAANVAALTGRSPRDLYTLLIRSNAGP